MKQTIDITDSILPPLSSFISALFIAAFVTCHIEKWRKGGLKAYFTRFWDGLVVWSTQGFFSCACQFFGVTGSANASTYSSRFLTTATTLEMVLVNPSRKVILYPIPPASTQALPIHGLTNEKVAQTVYSYKL